MTRRLLWGLILVPIFYYVALIGGAMTYPGYSHVTRYASELGAAGAPYPGLFNYNIIASGLAAIAGAAGLALSLRDLSGRSGWAMAAGICLAAWGAAMVMGGSFPMPDDRHGAYGLGLAGQLVPLFTILALRGVPSTGRLKLFLAVIFVASSAVLAVMFGVGELVTRANVGIWQRINSGLGIPWMTVLGIALLLRTKGNAAAGARTA
jgi:hypothetical protein